MGGTWAILVVVDLVATYVCFRKGKSWLAWIGVLAVVPPLTFVLVVVPVIGAITPGDADAEEAEPQPSRPPPPQLDKRRAPPHRAAPPSAERSVTEPGGSTRAIMIRAFLREAVADGIINGRVYSALVQRLEPTTPEAQAPATPSPPTVAPAPKSTTAVSPAPPVAQAPPLTTPKQVAVTPSKSVHPPVVRPTPERDPELPPAHSPAAVPSTSPTPEPVRVPEPPTPREPSRIAARRNELWEAFTSDVAVHGLVYLGVLLTFVSVLGFMLFAFTDLPISAKPFVELLIVLTFFGWAWLLNLQKAQRVSKAMELLGGMILPLVWYAALVDSAGFPPDAEGGPLVLALITSSLAISLLYWLISRRYENSMLRFLVWPMVWVAAMGIGYAFKTDEHLVGDAITRLVAPQPALASIAIAASLGFLIWRPNSRLADPTFIAALVGVPSAYLLTFGLSLGEGSSASWPILVAGLGTVVSIELVSHRFGWSEQLQSLRPYVYAIVGIPLVMAVGIGWGGAIVAVGYILLAEVALRSTKLDVLDVVSAAAGAIVGLVLSLAEPGSMAVAFGAVSIWSHFRRRLDLGNTMVAHSLTTAAALAPIGLLYSLSELSTVPSALLMVGGLVLVAAASVRVLAVADVFDSIWFPSAATVLGLSAALFWVQDGTSSVATVSVLVLSALTIALGQRWPTGNLWLSVALLSPAFAILLDTAGVSGAGVAVAWSAVGALTILISMVTSGGSGLRIAPGHLSALGHVLGLLAFTVSLEPRGFAVAMSGWAIGWLISLAAFERSGDIDPIAVWKKTLEQDRDAAVTLEETLSIVTPLLAVTTVTGAVAAVFVEAMPDIDQLAWIGPTLGIAAIVYSLVARWGLATRYGQLVFAWAAGLLAVAGVVLAYWEPWATILAAAVVVVVRLVLMGVRRIRWLTWASWLMSVVAAAAFASIIGVPDESLPAVTLGFAVGMLLVGLAVDEVVGGSRSSGEFIRTAWLWPPTVLGAVLVPSSAAALWLVGASVSEWAASMGVLGFAIASIMLRRSIWLTATLASVSLGLGLFAANAPPLGSAVVWSGLGLIAVMVAPFVPKPWRDDVAGIGHAVGGVGLAYGYNSDALVVALCVWALGWLIGVTSFELGGPSISRVLERSSTWWDEGYESWTVTGSEALSPAMAVTATAAAAFVLVEELVDASETRMWFVAIAGVLGFVFAVAGAYLARNRLTSLIFGWAGLALGAGAILMAIPEKLPIALAATLAIGTRLVVVKLIPDAWLSWVAWLLPTVAATSLASDMGLSDDMLGIVPVITGAVMLLGSLLADEFGTEPRTSGDLIRHEWLVAPSVLGAALMLAGLGSLLASEADIRIEASTVVVFTFAVTSLVLRRSIWLTATLASIGLALLLDLGGATSLQSASVWAVLGLVVVVSVPLVKSVPQDEFAAIGHLLGAVAFAYEFESNAYLIAITAWALGWLTSVAAVELGSPSVSGIFPRVLASPDDQEHSTLVRYAVAIPPLLAVVTLGAAALSLYGTFVGFDDARAWTAVVLAGLGLVYAAGTRFVISTKPAHTIFGWSAIILAASAVVVAIGEDVAIVVAASVFIGIRILLIGAVPHTWLSWPAWLMPFAISMAAGHAFGIPGQSVYLVSLATGVVMLIGSLVFDDVANTRRSIHEGLRTPWLRYPFVIGLLAVPFSLAPVFALDTATVGIASLAAAAGYVVVAVLLRAGSVTFAALGLAAFGTAVMLPRSSVENPWILVAMGAVMVLWSFVMERVQSEAAVANPWTRWDLPALAAGHVAVGVALVLTLDGTPDPATWIAAGALSMVVGIWRKNRWWMDAGLVLIVVGSTIAGEPWLIMALVIATARGMYGVWRDVGAERYIDHGIATAGFVAAWVDLVVRFEWTYTEAVSYGSMTAGLVAVTAAVLSRNGLVKKDTLGLWSALGASGVAAALVTGLGEAPHAIDGPWVGVGVVLIAISSEQWARILHPSARYATPVIAAFGWLVGLAGLGLSSIAAASYTVAVLGVGLALMMPIADRIAARAADAEAPYPVGVTRTWAIVALVGVVFASSVALAADVQGSWWLAAAASAFVAYAVATGGRAVGIPRLRTGTGLPALSALVAVLMALEVPPFEIGVAMTMVAAISTLFPVVRVSKHRHSTWIEMSIITGLAATVLAVPVAISEYPATELIVLILITVGGQAIAYGIVFKRHVLVALGPPMLGFAALALVVENAPSSTVWYTVPIAMVMLAEADLLHPMLSSDPGGRRHNALLILEWSGVALIGLPPLIEMFRTNLLFGLAGFALAAGLMAWALLTKVKRRLLAASIVATFSAILSLAAAAASNVQDSAAFWIVGGGIGFSIMLIAGSIEAYRSRSGALMERLGDLMEDWE